LRGKYCTVFALKPVTANSLIMVPMRDTEAALPGNHDETPAFLKMPILYLKVPEEGLGMVALIHQSAESWLWLKFISMACVLPVPVPPAPSGLLPSVVK